MKKKTIVFSCLAVLFLLSAFSGFAGGLVSGGVGCLVICGIFVFLAFRSAKPAAKMNKAVIGVSCGVAVLSVIAIVSGSGKENAPTMNDTNLSVSAENISDAESSSVDLPETSEQTESSSADLPETSEQTESSSADLPETSEQIENSSADLPETSEQTESSSADLPETSEQTESSSISLADTQNIQSTGNENNFNAHDNPEQQNTTASYVLNTSSHKFHYPNCSSVSKIAENNYAVSNSSRDELISQGYSPCGNCKP